MAAVLAVLAALTTTFAVTGAWARRTTIDTDHWVETVGPLASNPKVQAALGNWAGEELVQLVDLEGYVASALPKRAKILAAPLSGAVQDFIAKEVTAFLATDEFRRLWITANTIAHDRAIKVLKGEGEAVTTTNGKVVIDFVPLLLAVLDRVDQTTHGLLSKHVPAFSENMTGDEARAALADATGRDIPNDFGTIAVFDANQLSTVQDAVNWFQAGVIALVLLAIALAIAAIAIAPDRRHILVWLGLATAISIVVFRSAARAASKSIVHGIVLPRNRDAATSVLHEVLASYRVVTAAFIALGLLVALVAYLAGPSRVALAVRGFATRGSWLAQHRVPIQLAVLLLAFVAILVFDLTFSWMIVFLFATGAVEIALWRLPSGEPTTTTLRATSDG